MAPRQSRFTFWLDDEVLTRAKQTLIDRSMRGGVAKLIRDGLSMYLDELDKIPLGFDATFRRTVGREARLEDRWDCYGARSPRSGQMLKGVAHRFTLSELEQHCLEGRWDERTAELIAAQHAIWRARGDNCYAAKIYPPGWEKVSQAATAVAPGADEVDAEPYEPLE
jgi:hypothetical protein